MRTIRRASRRPAASVWVTSYRTTSSSPPVRRRSAGRLCSRAGSFFSPRGVSSISNAPSDALLVFHDGQIMGTLTVLDMLKPSDVRAVRRIGVTETYHRYGRYVSVGGLEVELVIDR